MVMTAICNTVADKYNTVAFFKRCYLLRAGSRYHTQ